MGIIRKMGKALQSLQDPMFRRALFHGVSPSHEHREMLANLGQLRTIVDVGANVGQFALLALRVQPDAFIHSFEPLNDAAQKFQKVITGNQRVKLHRCALEGEESILPIHVTSNAVSSSMLSPNLREEFFPGTHEVNTEEVPVRPLQMSLPSEEINSPALLKIDIQGFEVRILKESRDVHRLVECCLESVSFLFLPRVGDVRLKVSIVFFRVRSASAVFESSGVSFCMLFRSLMNFRHFWDCFRRIDNLSGEICLP